MDYKKIQDIKDELSKMIEKKEKDINYFSANIEEAKKLLAVCDKELKESRHCFDDDIKRIAKHKYDHAKENLDFYTERLDNIRYQYDLTKDEYLNYTYTLGAYEEDINKEYEDNIRLLLSDIKPDLLVKDIILPLQEISDQYAEKVKELEDIYDQLNNKLRHKNVLDLHYIAPYIINNPGKCFKSAIYQILLEYKILRHF